jgi:hypothetical protein
MGGLIWDSDAYRLAFRRGGLEIPVDMCAIRRILAGTPHAIKNLPTHNQKHSNQQHHVNKA